MKCLSLCSGFTDLKRYLCKLLCPQTKILKLNVKTSSNHLYTDTSISFTTDGIERPSSRHHIITRIPISSEKNFGHNCINSRGVFASRCKLLPLFFMKRVQMLFSMYSARFYTFENAMPKSVTSTHNSIFITFINTLTITSIKLLCL